MERIGSIKQTEERILAEMNSLLSTVRDFAGENVSDIKTGLSRLRGLRSSVYEDLNQIQHECLILDGLKWVKENCQVSPDAQWYWNPRQTGDSSEPDLRGVVDGEIVVSAEATASEKPQGGIDKRMRDTMAKLNKMDGKKFYFVRTDEMKKRAKTKVGSNPWSITVVKAEN